MTNIESMKHAFKVCALWSSTDWDGEPLDANYDLSDISDKAEFAMDTYVEKFISENEADIEQAMDTGLDASDIGHSLWLSSNGHGAGFFDYKGECFKRLQIAARGNEMDLYVGDDGKLYL